MKRNKLVSRITDRAEETLKSYFKEVSKFEPLSVEQSVALVHIINKGGHEGATAEEKLIKGNLRFVISVAKTFQCKTSQLADLVEAGNYGLIIAARKYNPEKNRNFLSYAVHWIYLFISRFVDANKFTIKRPFNKCQEMYRYDRMSEKLMQELEREPTIDEVLERMPSDFSMSVDDIKAMLNVNRGVASYDRLVGEDEDYWMSESIPGDILSDDEVLLINRRSALWDKLKKILTIDELEVLFETYGFIGDFENQKEIAQKHGKSVNWVTLNKTHALNMLRQKAEDREFELFLREHLTTY